MIESGNNRIDVLNNLMNHLEKILFIDQSNQYLRHQRENNQCLRCRKRNPGNGKDCLFHNGKLSEGRSEYDTDGQGYYVYDLECCGMSQKYQGGCVSSYHIVINK